MGGFRCPLKQAAEGRLICCARPLDCGNGGAWAELSDADLRETAYFEVDLYNHLGSDCGRSCRNTVREGATSLFIDTESEGLSDALDEETVTFRAGEWRYSDPESSFTPVPVEGTPWISFEVE